MGMVPVEAVMLFDGESVGEVASGGYGILSTMISDDALNAFINSISLG